MVPASPSFIRFVVVPEIQLLYDSIVRFHQVSTDIFDGYSIEFDENFVI